MSAWDDFLARLPMRMRPTMRDGDVGIAFRAICTLIDEERETVNACLKAATQEPDVAPLFVGKDEESEG